MIVIMSMIDDYHDSDDDQTGIDHKEDIYEDCDNWVVWGRYLWQLWLWQLGGLMKIFMTIGGRYLWQSPRRAPSADPAPVGKIFLHFVQTNLVFPPPEIVSSFFFCPKRILQLFFGPIIVNFNQFFPQ